jgi:hypothetical protein
MRILHHRITDGFGKDPALMELIVSSIILATVLLVGHLSLVVRNRLLRARARRR